MTHPLHRHVLARRDPLAQRGDALGPRVLQRREHPARPARGRWPRRGPAEGSTDASGMPPSSSIASARRSRSVWSPKPFGAVSAVDERGCACARGPGRSWSWGSSRARSACRGARDVMRCARVRVRSRRCRTTPAGAGSPRAGRGCRARAGRASTWRDGPRLDDAAVLEHRDGVGDLPHEGQVVRDEEIGESELLLQAANSTSKISACTVTSSADVGSSSTITSGCSTSARAIATRWRWPPDSCAGAPPRQLAAEPDGRERASATVAALSLRSPTR